MTFDDLFERGSTGHQPWNWQRELAQATECTNRTLRAPTGFGKTLGILTTWIWNRVLRNDDAWPRRLVWCLPMRVLVEQTDDEVRTVLNRLGLLWNDQKHHTGKVGVHRLMGGSESGAWHQYPEHFGVLIGTQDMLLSRALNRGYGAPRARWPMDFGLLSQDCLWIMDEVQLMDVGLFTSAQLQAFRDQDSASNKTLRPCATWWMSATLQRDWLAKSPDTQSLARGSTETSIPSRERTGPLWDDVHKPLDILEIKSPKALAKEIGARHVDEGRGARGPTLVVANTVDRAVTIWQALTRDKRLSDTDIRLVHSRFRPRERMGWKDEFLNRPACEAGADRIIVATQVIEAGVDISAGLLFTEIAPWASLVQRFGRCARWGGTATVVVARYETLKSQAPYERTAVDAAGDALERLATLADRRGEQLDVSPRSLERLEDESPDLIPSLYAFEPTHLLLRYELDELFDTTPDLSGADIDISRFIRSGDERDLHVFWAELPSNEPPPNPLRPSRDELCAVPFLRARDWLCKPKSEGLAKGKQAWVWDYQDGTWRRAARTDLYPGQTVLVAASCGGYDTTRGFDPKSEASVHTVPPAPISPEDRTDSAQDDETLSVSPWKTIATHGREAGAEARAIANTLVPQLSDIFDLGGTWHDVGKVHPAFRGSIRGNPQGMTRTDIAKAPPAVWHRPHKLYPMPDGTRRPGFRHELASTLALFGVLQRRDPDHPALLGSWRDLLGKAGLGSSALPRGTPIPALTPIETEILALNAADFDLLAYLVCSHHGKLRVAWHASNADQAASDPIPRIRGVRQGERLPAVALISGDGALCDLPKTPMDLGPSMAGISPTTGAAWTDRVLGLLDRYGPFGLAWLEALLRAADQRVSRSSTPDPLLAQTPETSSGFEQLETGHGDMESTPAGGAGEHRVPQNPPQGGQEHGLRGRAGGSEDAGGGTRAPHRSTRYLTTTLGVVSYSELAPHLALRVEWAEKAIAKKAFATRPLDESFIRDLHQAVCGDLVPQLAGRWRLTEVRVGSHQPPNHVQVPLLMRDYCLDLQARSSAIAGPTDDRIPELLAYAEGRLLSIRPFDDFNGRTTRLLLAELLRRLQQPAMDPTPEPGAETEAYLAALRQADRNNWQPLIEIWHQRFAKESQS